MLGLGLRRQLRRVGCQESEGRIRVLAILGKIKMHPPHQIPCRIPPSQEFLDVTLRLGQLDAERRVELLPRGPHDLGGQVLNAYHRGRGPDDAFQFVAGGWRNGSRFLSAYRRHVVGSEVTPISEDWWKHGSRFVRSEQ